MFSMGPQYNKLKTNFRLSINRLKLLEKKKTEQTQKARKEIADYISGHKEDRARIRVEHIIREDYIVEAYEILEMYCDLLLARFGLIQQMKELDEGIEEAVNSVMWAAPRLQSDIQELKVISDQLTAKYGKPFAEAVRQDQLGKVNPKLKQKLSIHAPPKILVEKYMMEIAKSHGVPFNPDPNVMREDEIAAAEAMLIDFGQQGGRGWMYPQVDGAGGMGPGGPGPPPPPPGGFYPPPPPPGGNDGGGGGGGGGIGMAHYQMPPQMPQHQQAFNYPQVKQSHPDSPEQDDGVRGETYPHEVKVPLNDDPEGKPSAPGFVMPELPDPPAAYPLPPDDNTPRNSNVGGGNKPDDDLDFDDLTRRFEELKKRR